MQLPSCSAKCSLQKITKLLALIQMKIMNIILNNKSEYENAAI